MFELPKNSNVNTHETDCLVASYVLELLFKRKDMYKINTKVVVYDNGDKEFFSTTYSLRKDIGYKLYDITSDVFSIVKREIAEKKWHLIKVDISGLNADNYMYQLKTCITQSDVDNPRKKIII